MPDQYLLSVGDGITSDYLNLNDGANYLIPLGNALLVDLPRIQVPLEIQGESPNDLWENVQAIHDKLRQAREAVSAHRNHAGVTLSVRLSTNEWVYFDVLDGRLVIPGNAYGYLSVDRLRGCTLELDCRPLGRGDRTEGGFNAGQSLGAFDTLWLPNVPGNADALARIWVVDGSYGGHAINRLRIARQSDSALTEAGVSHVVPLSASGFGQTVEDPGDTVSGDIASITASADWRTIATGSRPADLTNGRYLALLRCRDSSAAISQPLNLELAEGSVDAVQSAHTNGSVAASSGVVTWPNPTTAGNLLILRVMTEGATISTPSGWTAGPTANNGARIALFYIANAASQSDDVTVTFGGSTKHYLWLEEWSGMATSTPLDVSYTATGTSGSTGSVALGPTTATAQAHELALAMVGANDQVGSTWGSAFVHQFSASLGTGSDDVSGAKRILTSTGTVSTSVTVNGLFRAVAAIIATFKAASSAAPDLAADTYTVRVAPLDSDGNEGIASAARQIVLDATGAISLRWDAPASGLSSVAEYRVYWHRGAGWKYFDTGSTATQYNLTTETSASTDQEPITASTLNGAFRLQVGLAGGGVLQTLNARSSVLANGQWELLPMDTLELPPVAAGDGDDPRDWTVAVQGRHPSLGSTLDVDALLLMPHGAGFATAEFVDGDGNRMQGTRNRVWKLETDRQGRTSAVLIGGTIGLTASGHEITDSVRGSAVEGDGLAVSGKTGIWQAGTNLVVNGGFEGGTALGTVGWTTGGTNVIAVSDEQVLFGSLSLKCTYGNSGTLAIYAGTLTAAPYTYSGWVYVPTSYSGTALTLRANGFASATGTTSVAVDMDTKDAWQRVHATFSPASGDLVGTIELFESGATAPDAGDAVYLDGVQIEAGSLVTPYINTAGSTDSRGTALVQFPASGIDETQAWVATRVEIPAIVSGTIAPIFTWGDDSQNLIYLYAKSDGNYSLGRAASNDFSQSDSALAGSFSFGTAHHTLLMRWNSSNVYLSENGGTFTLIGTAGSAQIPTLTETLVNFGNDENIFATSAGYLNGNIHWAAWGTGTLTDNDAGTINAWGDTVPAVVMFGSAAACNAVWNGSQTDYALDDTEDGIPAYTGELSLGPGGNHLSVVADDIDGVSDADHVRYAVRVDYISRFKHLRGTR